MFLIQATLESATVIGDGVTELIKQEADEEETIHDALARIRDEALEPYATRYSYFKDLLNAGGN